jgi:protein-L-isoaspartate(D-aspartate) O-methyltransferase
MITRKAAVEKRRISLNNVREEHVRMDTVEEARMSFAQRIHQQGGIKSASLIRGLATVPREHFVGPGPWKILRPAEMAKGYQLTPDDNPRHLYDNVLVALDAERLLNNGEPLSLLVFLDTLDLAPGHRFLHVGCGVGYYTAIAAEAVSPNGSVVGIEIDNNLAARAEQGLRSYKNVRVVSANGSFYTGGLFNAIFVNAGCTHLQSIWLDQLAVGGRLLVPLTVSLPTSPGIGTGLMLLITRRESDYIARFTSPVAIFHCEGARTPEGNTLLLKAFAQGDHSSVVRLRRDEHQAGQDCWLHGSDFCLEASASLKRKQASIDPTILANYVGRYQFAPDFFATVTLEGNQLFVQRTGRPKGPVYPASEKEFFYKLIDAQITFVTDESGRATELVFHRDGRDSRANRVE